MRTNPKITKNILWGIIGAGLILGGLCLIPREMLEMTGIPKAWENLKDWPKPVAPKPSEVLFLITIACFWVIMAAAAELWKMASKQRLRYSLARPLSVLPILILLNSIEHHIGLGTTGGSLTLIILTSAGGWLVWRGFKTSSPLERKERILLECAFAAGLAVTFLFNRLHPDIISLGEESTWNLSHLASFSQGTVLPPDNSWLPGVNNTAYYTFGHYAAGWLHRLGNLSMGQTYHAGIMLAIAWACCAFAATTWNITHGRTVATIVATATILLGANFAPLAALITQKDPQPHQIKRFVGEAIPTENKEALSPIGKEWADQAQRQWEKTHTKPMPIIPSKQFSYLTQSGTLMPPTLGMPLLGILLAGLAGLGKRRSNIQSAPLWAGITIGIALAAIPITNMWVTIPAAIITVTWLGVNACLARKDTKKTITGMIAGGGIAGLLLLETLKRMAASIETSQTHIRLLGSEAAPHTPLWGWVVIFGGAALWVLLALAGHQKGTLRSNMIAATATSLVLLAVFEFIYIDDYVGDKGERFNSGLKWYPIVMIIAGTACGGLALVGNHTRFLAGVLATTLTIPTLLIHANTYRRHEQSHGDWSGLGWVKRTHPALVNLLQELPDQRIVLEHEPLWWGHTIKSIALLTENKSWIGWAGHIKLHNEPDTEAARRKKIANRFYAGDPTAAGELITENVDVIVWAPSVLKMHAPGNHVPPSQPCHWESHQRVLDATFTWKETNSNPKEGIWVRKP